MADEVRTALIAAAASIVVGTISGMVTYNTTKTQVQSQIATASLTHAKDIAGAVHDSLDDLFSPDAGRVKTTLAGLYFLGSGQEERQQIVETAGSAGTPQVRAAISYVLTVDRAYGQKIASNPDVVEITVSQNALPPNGKPTSKPSSAQDVINVRTANDALDQTISLLNGSGWIYLGLGPTTGQAAVDADLSIAPGGLVKTNAVVKFVKNLNFRQSAPDDSGFAPSIGTVKPDQLAVILSTKTYQFNHYQRAVWGEVFLCDAPAGVTRPSAASACPHAAAVNGG